MLLNSVDGSIPVTPDGSQPLDFMLSAEADGHGILYEEGDLHGFRASQSTFSVPAQDVTGVHFRVPDEFVPSSTCIVVHAKRAMGCVARCRAQQFNSSNNRGVPVLMPHFRAAKLLHGPFLILQPFIRQESRFANPSRKRQVFRLGRQFQLLPEVANKRVHEDGFDALLCRPVAVLVPTSGCRADLDPVGGPIARPVKFFQVDEAFNQIRSNLVFLKPVVPEVSEHRGHNH